ncbi:MAG: phosphotransferase [Candidatus Bipolaricaulota bacterium]
MDAFAPLEQNGKTWFQGFVGQRQGADEVAELRKVIGRGRTAEILAWGDGRVLKLYVAESHRDYVRREATTSRRVHQLGLPAPAVYDAETPDGLHEVDGRLGILYERIDGPTMMRDLGSRPWTFAAHSRKLARLHAQIHAAPGEGLPLMRPRIERSIERAGGLVSPAALRAARDRLSSLPDVRQVCHGDFHPDNVILGARGLAVVDWGPASAGHPLADVAWTYLLYRFAGVPPGTPAWLRRVISLVRRGSLRVYLQTYFAQTGSTWADLKPWLGVVAVLRLGDKIPEERDRLVRFIEREFRGHST